VGARGVGTVPPPATARRVAGAVAPWTGRGWLVAAASFLTGLLIDVLRVWLPSVVHVQGDAGSTPALQLGAFALLWFLLPFPLALATRRLHPALLFTAGVAVLAALRIGLQFTAGGRLQLWLACAALVAGITALVALAAGTPSGHLARVGVVVGIAVNAVAHAALGTLDLVWRPGPLAASTVVIIAGVAVLAAERARRVPLWWPTATRSGDGLDEGPAAVWTRGAAWPWLGVGPAIALSGILVAAPARFEIAVGWSPATVVVALAVTGGITVLLATTSPAIGGPLSGGLGAAAVLLGTLGSLRPDGWLAVAGQLLLLIGVGLVLGAPGTTPGDSGPRRRGSAAAGSMLLFFLVGFLYYASYELPLPFPNRAVLLLGAAGLAVLGVTAGWAGRDLRRTGVLPTRTAAASAAVATLLALLGAFIAPAAAGPSSGTLPPDGSLRVAAFNVHSGYGMDGRFDPVAIADVLRDEAVDVVVLNEVDRGWLLEGGHDLLSLLRRDLDLPHAAFAPAADEVWGNAILSRVPIESLRVERLPRAGAAMQRSLLSAVVSTATGERVAIVGTHLHHVTEEPAVRLAQARAVAAEVSRLRSRNLPVAVLGDLNAPANAPELEPLGFMRDAVPGGAPTYPADDPVARLDHVLVSGDLTAFDRTIVDTQVSDHRPVVVTLSPAEVS
jgi:endonuclease/exonuclease/phosphatase family metal-dependent hydrolase/uncharacterized membrane protein